MSNSPTTSAPPPEDPPSAHPSRGIRPSERTGRQRLAAPGPAAVLAAVPPLLFFLLCCRLPVVSDVIAWRRFEPGGRFPARTAWGRHLRRLVTPHNETHQRFEKENA
ncbi:hypothetical protein [Streptomyces sp. NPDC093594]|uniref:hypothetical protein n=1 Tax=Streptomyces sp. NPDC093594 TaxID=3155305 RepID=UPI00344CA141